MSMPKIIEKRNTLVAEMETLTNTAEAETRSLNETEINRFDEIKKEITDIDKTLDAEKEVRKMQTMVTEETQETENKKKAEIETRELDIKNFAAFIRGEKRALTVTDNGAAVPVSIAQDIIKKVYDIAPVLAKAYRIDTKGDVTILVDSSDDSADYLTEETDITDTAGQFTSISVKSYIIGKLCLISKSLINRTDVDLVNYASSLIASGIAHKLEKEALIGTTNKMQGALSTTNVVTTASSTAIAADELIDLMGKVASVYQPNACFVMNRDTLTQVRKLKTDDKQYIFGMDATMPFGFSIFGKPVYVSDSMPTVAAGAKAVLYGDFAGLCLKVTKDVEVQVLDQLYAGKYAVGVLGSVEADSKIRDNQALAVLQLKASV